MFALLLITLSAVLMNESDAALRERLYNSPVTGERLAGSLKVTGGATAGGICDPNVKQESGYYNVNSEGHHDANYFYWMFESRSEPSKDPLILWLTGGPGCSSQLALMTENGPCTPNKDGTDTVNNPYSWTNNANVLWLDQPAGVGYSYGNGAIDVLHNETQVAEDAFHFLQSFFEAHPEYHDNEFFVFGESYGGHYAPAISSRVFEGNNNQEGVHINLAGVGVGNGLTDPVVQYQYYDDMAMNNTYNIKCVSEEQYEKMQKHEPTCIKMAKACQADVDMCAPADEFCNMFLTTPYYSTGLNPYDIRKPCEGDLCYDFSNVDVFLNLNSTREALGVSDKVETWESCNTAVNAAFMSDWMRSFQQKLVPMLENGIRVLIYAGDVDFICNWMGNKAWTKELNWSGKSSFNAAQDYNWEYGSNHVIGGKIRSADAMTGSGTLTFMQIYQAGHMVPMDQPEAALSMLKQFTFQKYF